MAVAHRDAGRPPAPVAPFWYRHREQVFPFLFVIPALVYVGYFAFYPAADAVVLSFQTPIESFTTFNYEFNVGQGMYTWIGNTLWVTVGALALQFGLALAIASILAREFRGKAVFATIAILPIGIATVVAGYAWSQILPGNGSGYANSFLHVFGVAPVYWLNTNSGALAAVVVADSWKNTSLVVIILVAGYASIPKTLYQAAAIDGAGPLRQFRYVTLPGLRSFIVIALLIRGAQEVNIFQLAYEMISSSPQLLTVEIYDLWSSGGGGIYLASSAASVLLGIIAIFIVAVLALGARD
jgi:trehalose transport system permease protein